MRKRMIAWGTVCLSATVLLAQTKNKMMEKAPPANATPKIVPLNVKTGLWQLAETITWTGLPPQLAAAMDNGHTTNYQSCVKPRDLNSNPWAGGSGEKCTWTALNSNGTDMEVQAKSCQLRGNNEYTNGMTADADGKIHVIDSENGTGSFDITLTGNGLTMHGHAAYTGKWMRATCPSNIN